MLKVFHIVTVFYFINKCSLGETSFKKLKTPFGIKLNSDLSYVIIF